LRKNKRESLGVVDLRSYEKALYQKGYRAVCGIDEVGRGPLAGPVIAAAVILPKAKNIEGLRDSKRLTPLQRERFFDTIQNCAEAIGIGVVENETIDRINILQSSLLAMRKALDALKKKPDYLLIDALTLPGLDLPQKGIIHGDDLSISIAAASVIAKVTRDRLMIHYHDVFPAYDFHRHKGYGTRVHLEKIKEFGPCRLHRKSFRGVIN